MSSCKKKIIFFTMVLLLSCFRSQAQSSQATREQSLSQLDKATTNPAFVPDPKADKYKLVFMANETGQIGYTEAEMKKFSTEIKNNRELFIAELNKFGTQGYKVVPFGTTGPSLVRLGNSQYEYTHIETRRVPLQTKGNASRGRIEKLAEKGFAAVAVATTIVCGGESPFDPEKHEIFTPHCSLYDRILMERAATAAHPNQIWLAQSGAGPPNAEELTDVVKEGLLLGLTPTHVFNSFQILMQKSTPQREFAPDRSQTLVVIAKNEKKFRLRINELAAQGFRLALSTDETAVMYQLKSDATPISYIWIDAKKKDYEQQLLALQSKGATFQKTHAASDRGMTNLIFAQGGTGDGKQHEYKILKFELQSREYITARRVESELSPASKEELITLNRLALEGYEVRAIFTADDSTWRRGVNLYRFNLLLERIR